MVTGDHGILGDRVPQLAMQGSGADRESAITHPQLMGESLVKGRDWLSRSATVVLAQLMGLGVNGRIFLNAALPVVLE